MHTVLTVPSAVGLRHGVTLFHCHVGDLSRLHSEGQHSCLVMLPRFGAIPALGSLMFPGPGTLGTIHSSIVMDESPFMGPRGSRPAALGAPLVGLWLPLAVLVQVA